MREMPRRLIPACSGLSPVFVFIFIMIAERRMKNESMISLSFQPFPSKAPMQPHSYIPHALCHASSANMSIYAFMCCKSSQGLVEDRLQELALGSSCWHSKLIFGT